MSMNLSRLLSDIEFLSMLTPTFQLMYKKDSTQFQLHILSASTQVYVTYKIDCDIAHIDAMYSLDSRLLINALKYYQSKESHSNEPNDMNVNLGFKFDLHESLYFLCVYDMPAYSSSRNIKLNPAQLESLLDIERIDQTIPELYKSIEFETVNDFHTILGVCLTDPILYTQVSADDESVSLSAYDTSNHLVTKLYTTYVTMNGYATPELFFDFKLLHQFLNHTDLSKQTCRFVWTCNRPVELEIGSSLVAFVAPCEHQQPSEQISTTNRTKKQKKQ